MSRVSTKKIRSNSNVELPKNPKRPYCSKALDTLNLPIDLPSTKQRTKLVAMKKPSICAPKAKKTSKALLEPNLFTLNPLSKPLDSNLECDLEIEEIIKGIIKRDIARI